MMSRMTADAPASPSDLAPALGHDLADRRLAILRHIAAGNSISQAAREAGVSYKAAWQALDVLTNLAGCALVERSVGGAGGGGARITAAGQSLLAMADALEQARAQVLQRFGGPAGVSSAAPGLGLGLRTSMRNLWPCRVGALQAQGAQVRVWMLPDGGGDAPGIAARITAESAQLLGLAPGLPVMALCKATAVQVLPVAPLAGAQGLANAWPAKVQRLARAEGDGPREVVARLPWGGSGVGYAAQQAQGEPWTLRTGRKVWLSVPESAVVLAVAD
ncbi:LysR family transcriptional regulator [Delftia lacustris]|jgi:molybdate transport system regulatory protein|uniref:TOBE domain-containing protein n=1 Tax=Delftia TaxID=80865 RepID=UPI00193BDF5D|nr:TOBE domain-containing protein [Delftia lacustris]QRI89722.1 LysR family transcriptional regulator [Delftia lacustris]